VLPPPPPIVGFADTHTHPDAHQSFGGLQGHRTYMGVPGGRYADYLGATGADMYAHDIKDINTHLAGTFALRVLIGLIHELAPDMAQGLHEQMHITEVHRAWEGGLRLMSSLAMSNQAMEHMTGKIIDRDTGGDPCVDLGGLCMRDGRVRATIRTTPDRQVIAAHVLAMRELARLNADWMEIAYNPEDAYRIMAEGKLAVVLGTEVDSLGSLGFPTAEDEVDWLWGLGVRQLTPVHAIDNAIGGAVAFQDLYDTTEDLVNRPERDARRDTIQDELHRDGVRIWNPAARFGAFMKVENYGCHFAIGGVVAPPGECVDWRYDDEQKIFGLDTNILTGPHPMFATAGGPFDGGSVYGASLREDGQRNRMGLSDYGVRYVRAMMKRGMLLDVEHMSDHTIDALIASGALPGEPRGPLWDALPPGQNGCELGSYSRRRSMRAGCFDDVYPIMSSHTSLRGQSMVPSQEQVRGVTTLPAVSAVKGYWAREFERTPRQVEFIRQSGGTIAPVVGHDPILRPQTVTRARGLDPVPAVSVFRGEDGTLRTDADRLDLNNCAGSSKSWITAYLYSVQKMRGRGVALSTDMAVVGSTGPRFDPPGTAAGLPKSCPSSYALFNPEFDILDIAHPREALAREMTRGREAEERLYPWQYQRAAQNDSTRIHYYDPSGFAEPPGYLVRHRAPDGRVFDFNTEGIKTYGSLPDLLQDAVNVGVAREDLAPLLHSAQDYVDMWRKAYRVTGCTRGPLYSRCAGRGLTPIAESVCANTCPDSPGRGSAVLPDGTPIFR
jgi:microsomal dipeptidase-like Zn-dependent dipeptidase